MLMLLMITFISVRTVIIICIGKLLTLLLMLLWVYRNSRIEPIPLILQSIIYCHPPSCRAVLCYRCIICIQMFNIRPLGFDRFKELCDLSLQPFRGGRGRGRVKA